MYTGCDEVLPDIYRYTDNFDNPTLTSPSSLVDLPFEMTRETMLDVETYKSFITSAISMFRTSKEYKAYKSYLMSLGLDHCQIFGYLSEDELGDRGIEMHHNFLTIYDIAFLITEHSLNTVGHLSTFDLVDMIIEEHKNNRIPIVMLSKTPHQLYHADNNNFLPPDMTFGKWWELIYTYRFGVSMDIAKKIIMFIQQYLDDNNYRMMVKIRDNVLGFVQYNEYVENGGGCINYIEGNESYNFLPGGTE